MIVQSVKMLKNEKNLVKILYIIKLISDTLQTIINILVIGSVTSEPTLSLTDRTLSPYGQRSADINPDIFGDIVLYHSQNIVSIVCHSVFKSGKRALNWTTFLIQPIF